MNLTTTSLCFQEDAISKQTSRFPRRGNVSATRRKPSTRVFEVLPPSGILAAGQKVNVQIKFTPNEDVGNHRWGLSSFMARLSLLDHL